MLDLKPATRTLSTLVIGVPDDQLTIRTPCTEASLGDLLDHIDGFCLAFTAAATKTLPRGHGQGPSADASRLGPDWRSRIPQRLESLAGAWRAEDAWTGMTQVGGIDLPGEMAGLFALNEVIVHGWDLAVASGQSVGYEPDLIEPLFALLQKTVAEHPQGNPGLFGPPVPVPADTPRFDQLIALTGRDPAWSAVHAR